MNHQAPIILWMYIFVFPVFISSYLLESDIRIFEIEIQNSAADSLERSLKQICFKFCYKILEKIVCSHAVNVGQSAELKQ